MNKRTIIFAAVVNCLFSLHAENIQFADSKVKALCVQNWDSNKDGELSTDEAAAVTTLGSVFRGNKVIDTFEELAYFTGLTAIDDYAFNGSSIRKVSFPSSVTEIGESAFCATNLSGELHIPGTVKNVGNYAFNSCLQITGVILEEGVETVGYYCFSGPIGTLSIPSTLSYIGPMAIDPYVNAGSSSGVLLPEGELYVYVHSTTPPAINSFAFYYLNGAGHLVVPYGTKDAYMDADGWTNFIEYLEFGDVNMDGDVDVADAVCIVNRVIGKPTPKFLEGAADANNDGEIDVADAVRIINWIIGKTDNNSSPIGHDEEDPIEPQ